MTRAHPLLHAIAVILLSTATISHAEERYEVIDYCPSDWKILSRQPGLNITKDAKKIVGSYSDTNGKEHGLIIEGKKCSTLDYPRADRTQLGAANTRGELVGMSVYNSPSTGEDVYRGFLYRNGKFVTLLDPELDPESRDITSPTGITSKGDILVNEYANDCSGSFLLKKKTAILLPIPGTCDEFGDPFAMGINDKGVVVGYYRRYEPESFGGFILKKGVLTTIKYPGTDGSGTELTGINNKNEVVGYNLTGFMDTYPYHRIATGFLYKDGTFKTIEFPGSLSTMPTAISDKGSVIVVTFVTPEGEEKGFLYYPH